MSDHTPPASGDPSMEDILASIRRILNEGEEAPGGASNTTDPLPAPPAEPTAGGTGGDDGVLVLDEAMLVQPPAEPPPAPPTPAAPLPLPAEGGLLGPDSEASAAASVGALLRTLSHERSAQVYRGGPTIEDLVREELRPLLKLWLDEHLPPLVERLVRGEIERVTGRASL